MSGLKLARLMGGLGIAKVKLDLSGNTPRIRLIKPWSHKLKPIEELRTCYYGDQCVVVVPLVAWPVFRQVTRKKFERVNRNKSFDEWVEDPACDVEVTFLGDCVRWYLSRDHFEWAKIPLKKGTRLFMYRERRWIIISTVRKDPNQVPAFS